MSDQIKAIELVRENIDEMAKKLDLVETKIKWFLGNVNTPAYACSELAEALQEAKTVRCFLRADSSNLNLLVNNLLM